MRWGSKGGWVDYPALLQFSEKLCCLGLLKQEALFELPYSSMLQLRLSLVTHQEGNQRKKRKQTGENKGIIIITMEMPANYLLQYTKWRKTVYTIGMGRRSRLVKDRDSHPHKMQRRVNATILQERQFSSQSSSQLQTQTQTIKCIGVLSLMSQLQLNSPPKQLKQLLQTVSSSQLLV